MLKCSIMSNFWLQNNVDTGTFNWFTESTTGGTTIYYKSVCRDAIVPAALNLFSAHFIYIIFYNCNLSTYIPNHCIEFIRKISLPNISTEYFYQIFLNNGMKNNNKSGQLYTLAPKVHHNFCSYFNSKSYTLS